MDLRLPTRTFRVLLLLTVGLLAACDDNGGVEPVVPDALVLSSVMPDSLLAGSSTAFSVRVVDADSQSLPGIEVTWSVDDGKAEPTASVSNGDGIASTTWTAPTISGSSEITATTGSVSLSRSVRVTAAPASQLVVTPDEVTFTALGDSVQLAAVSLDTYGNERPGDPQAEWTITDTALARIDADGSLHAIGPGSTTAVASLGTLTDSVAVTIEQAPNTLESMDSLSVMVSEQDTLKAVFRDANGYVVQHPPAIEWQSRDTALATVTEDGVVAGVRAGSVWVVASYMDMADSTQITVTDPPAWERLSWTSHDLGSLTAGSLQSITAGGNSDILVGTSQSSAMLHYDGVEWSRTEVDCSNNYMWDQWRDPETERTWIIGGGYWESCVVEWDGSTFTRHTPPGISNLYAVDGVPGSNSVTVAGIYGILEWDGTSWSSERPDSTDGLVSPPRFEGVLDEDTVVWAVGGDGLAAHWNGTAWTRIDTGFFENFEVVFRHPNGTLYIDDLMQTESGWIRDTSLPGVPRDTPLYGPGNVLYANLGGELWVETDTGWERVATPAAVGSMYVTPEVVVFTYGTTVWVGVP